ncbi:hypothetical protein [Bordetella genomosp. 13]|uniref:hypothetical protein n=1 Tax=Bordetella genomosp. 13 TaxID=463040 RepID=UPI0011AAD0DB|nr:hypothetical protein [Bordetella genomosp. 13]
MTIDSVSRPVPGFPQIDAFTQAAQGGGDVYISVAGAQLQVLGTGATPGGRSVAWVAPDTDTVSMFSQALANTYGNGIASAVSRELGLAASPGRPLAARTIELAVDMAQTSRQALDGVDFATRLACSASTGSSVFMSACSQAGINPASLDVQQRHTLDAAMQQRFDQAAASGHSPVSLDTARTWLAQLLVAAPR